MIDSGKPIQVENGEIVRTRAIFRSAGLRVRYLDPLRVHFRGRETALGGLLRYHRDLAAELHARDRVHTYGSFYIADLPT